MNKSKSSIWKYLNEVFPDVLSKLIIEYDYYLSGESHILGKCTSGILCISVLSDGRIVSGSTGNYLTIWNPQKHVTREYDNYDSKLVGHTDWVRSIAILSTKSTEKIVSASDDRTIKIWDPETGTCDITLFGHSSWVKCITIRSDDCNFGNKIVSGSIDKTIKIWNPTTGNCDVTLVDGRSVYFVAIVPNNQFKETKQIRILSGSDDGIIKIWNSYTRTCEGTLDYKFQSLFAKPIYFNNNSYILFVRENELRIFDILNEDYNVNLIGHTATVLCCTILPDYYGCRIVSGSNDKTLKIWNHSGELEQTLKGHECSVGCTAMLPNGNIVSGSYDGTIRIWT